MHTHTHTHTHTLTHTHTPDELSSISGSGTELSEEEDGAREVGKGEERNSPLVQFSTLEGGCYAVYRCVVASASVKVT